MAIDVLLAHPHPSVRAALAGMLGGESDIDVVGECGDGRRALDLAGRLLPDVLVTGLRLPGLDGVELTRRLVGRTGPHGGRVVVLADAASCALAFEALGAGARGLLCQDTDTGELPRALRLVGGGGALVSPRLTRPLIDACLGGPGIPETPALDNLTAREREVLSLVGTGLSTQEIADRLVVAEVTAKTHVRRTMVKLGARTRTRLVAIAYESGMLRPRARS
ncbi:response regulator transcription factor [Streptomyces sp. S3(2020)]|uniref:LuxR C-terminal-related transcriptional regulator n=1 Tax=Streptomyces sp. S3(2020) TaxID=2732044 RepID=UPI0014877AF7|nr:response regulator transcription factor [Streptomyces sp. S3(2020)]NNN37770.1 response regulator transcription factor [Streptomyces sp. S3(2020)]